MPIPRTQRARSTGSALAAAVALGLTGLSLTGCSSGAGSSAGATPAGTSSAASPAASEVATGRGVTSSTTTATTGPTRTPSATSSGRATPTGAQPTSTPGRATGTVTVVRTLATGVDVPWGLARLPDGTVLVSARDSSRIYRLDVAAARLTRVGTVPDVVSNVAQQGEAGLLGIAVSRTFSRDHVVYAYYSTAADNRIAAIPWNPSAPNGRQLGTPRPLVTGIPHNVHHDGGRLAFGPDGYLYATTGEAQQPALAQDKGSLGGKILRMTTAGRPAPGNPFGTLVWSYGHRNVQGIDWDPAGRLWASEFGDHSEDELNLVSPGHNYGWPQTEGRTSRTGITGPVAQWGPPEDSPSGIAIVQGSVWMAALRGQRLWRIPLDGPGTAAAPQAFLVGRYGRLRSVLAVGPDTLLVTTSNRDGRQSPSAGDDRILLLRVT
jgi:glucose/arabinose dehydrogenase